MSRASSSSQRIQNWIPPNFAWVTAPDVFCIKVSLRDPEIVEFISTGIHKVTVHCSKVNARMLASILDQDSLRRHLEEAVWLAAKLKPISSRIKSGATIVAHCHGVFLLPDEKTLSVLVGRTKPVAPNTWIAAPLKAEADALLAEHQAKVAEFDERIKLKK